MNVIDVKHDGGIDWSPGMAPCRAAAGELLRAFDRTIQDTLGGAGAWALLQGARALHVAFGAQFGHEVDGLARAIGVGPEAVLVGNLAYDLTNAAACSTFVTAGDGPPVHARNLDWAFPGQLLREHTTVVRVSGAPAGNYAMVGWPGFFGGLTAVAPGRFSVTVNFVAQEDDTPAAAFGRAVKRHWPVPWAVRMALDECEDYRSCVDLLSTLPLLSPVLFAVAGIRRGEAVIIERTPGDFVLREPRRGSVCVTNHYASDDYRQDGLDTADSEERLSTLERSTRRSPPRDPGAALRLLSRPLFLRAETQHQVVMSAAAGTLVVTVPGQEAVELEA
ncbi:MAG: C45 family peptidase [Deltaproteobacteria bacterium]